MAREKLMTAALAVLATYDYADKAPRLGEMTGVIDRLRAAAHRRCETCDGWEPHGPFVKTGQCGIQSHNPPRSLDDTCQRWKEGKMP